MKRLMYILTGLAGVLLCVCGCSKDEAVTASPGNVNATPQTAVNIAHPTPTTVLPPPIAVVGPPPSATGDGKPSAPVPGSSLETLVGPRGGVYFYDDDRNFLAKDQLDFLQRAIRGYNDYRDAKHDDSPDWPVLSDLSMLVQYKIVKGLPAPPAGHKFVFDMQSRKVTLAAL